MAHLRPLVSVFDPENQDKISGTVATPGVFSAPIRLDIVQFVHTNISKNFRQAHGVMKDAGMQHSAESWHPGRAVARIPRVGGSGSYRSGQAAFGNMVRKGRMFAPLKTWRRWHRKVNVTQKRHAVAAALAASFLAPLVLARGHRAEHIRELPLVVEDKVESYDKTKQVVNFLKRFGVYEDVQRVVKSKTLHAGRGKIRNRRYRQRRGPLIIVGNENVKLARAARNIPGVEVNNVNRLNLRQLAPGGTLGRLIIWTKSAFQALDHIFGSHRKNGVEKKGYALHHTVMTNADIGRIINSDEIQSVVRPTRRAATPVRQKRNPLKNDKLLNWLNPHASVLKNMARQQAKAGQEARAKGAAAARKLTAEEKKALKEHRKKGTSWIKNVLHQLDDAAKRQDKGTLANH